MVDGDNEIDVEDDLRRLAELGEDINAETVFAKLREEIEQARRDRLAKRNGAGD